MPIFTIKLGADTVLGVRMRYLRFGWVSSNVDFRRVLGVEILSLVRCSKPPNAPFFLTIWIDPDEHRRDRDVILLQYHIPFSYPCLGTIMKRWSVYALCFVVFTVLYEFGHEFGEFALH